MSGTAPPTVKPTRLRWWWYLGGTLVVGAVAGLAWFALRPTMLGIWDPVEKVVLYPGPDAPTATIAALFVIITATAGLLCGIPAVGIRDGKVTARSLLLVACGLPAALVTYLTGFLLGPASIEAQRAAEVQGIQAPLMLPSPLLALAWPAATAAAVTVGLALSLLLVPTDALDRDEL